ncbi:MAG: hypothetical protein E7183_03460 [Erysipelotrichaceae bacterium]|nr:hypothetical protein [Erysipelotrichaceae bacterium]
MDIFISIIILILLCFIFYKEYKSDKPVDLFINVVISCVCIITPLFTFLIEGFDFANEAHIIYLVVMVISVIFTVYYLIKYNKNKDKNQIDEENKEQE